MKSVHLNVIVALLTLFQAVNPQSDLTRTPETAGTDVVLATISLIQQSGVFSDDNRFLRRVAFVESGDGLEPDTFRDGYNGGIWQVDEANFLKTMDQVAHPFLAEPGGIYERIAQTLEISWVEATWINLRIPIISAIAARIFFELAMEDIPDIGDVEGQGEFWKSTGFNTNIEDTVELFVERIRNLELEECPNRGIDLAFVLDSSGSVGKQNFSLERDLVSSIVGRFPIGPDATQVAVISFSGFAVVNFQFNDFTNRSQVQRAVSQVQYFDVPVVVPGSKRKTSTNTADALTRLRTEVLVEEAGARTVDVAIPRVVIVITDGRSNINASLTIPSALALREEGVTVYSVGVGKRLNMTELEAIASSPDNVRLLEGFDVTEFDGLRSRITADVCVASVSVGLSQSVSIELDQGEVSYLQYQVPTEGITVTLLKQEGSTTLYASGRLPNPNSAFYDYRIDEEGEVFVDLQELIGGREKRDVVTESADGAVLYVSLEGVGDGVNTIEIETTLGNTIASSAITFQGAPIILLLSLLCQLTYTS